MSEFEGRCQRAQAAMREQAMDWLFISSSSDLLYLTGYHSRPSERMTLLMLPQSGRPTLVMPSFEVARLAREGHAVFYDVTGWAETDNPYLLAKRVSGGSPGTVGVGDQMWGMFLLPIIQLLSPDTRYVSATRVVGPLRMRKDATELALLREVGRRMDRVFAEVCRLSFAGRTELEIGSEVFQIVAAQGLSPARAGGVASGPNSASPHHRSMGRTIEPGDAVWIELGQGGNYGSYYADKTRALHVGEPSAEYLRAYGLVRQAMETAYRAVRPGLPCQEVDRVGRRVIQEAGYGPYFNTRIGHGVGIDGHEPPYMTEGNSLLLEPGMVFSIEPGIYIPGRFGIRIEDIVAVTEEGAEDFYASTHDLIVVE